MTKAKEMKIIETLLQLYAEQEGVDIEVVIEEIKEERTNEKE